MSTILLGLALSFDSFQASMVLGTMRPGAASQIRLALAFGVCDGIAPLLGLSLGPALVNLVSSWARVLGALLLVGYGTYQLIIPLGAGDDSPDRSGWVVMGIPLFLSQDNLVAGFALGMTRLPIVPTAATIGTISSLMSLVGLRCGAAIGRKLPVQAERVGGAALILMSLALVLNLF